MPQVLITQGIELHDHHSLSLVALSLLIAMLVSYTALDLAGRIRTQSGRLSLTWLAGAAVAMGGGIWSMHFIAMLAFHIGIPVTYDMATILLALVVAILVTGVGLFIVHWHRGTWDALIIAGVLMGGGIAAMHYTGMAAMRMAARIVYDPPLVALSVIIAIVAAIAALWCAFSLRRIWQKLGSAVVMAIAIASMHFTGMAAARYELLSSAEDIPPIGLSHGLLAVGIGAAAFVLLTLALAAAFVDRRLGRAQREAQIVSENEQRFRALVQRSSDIIAVIGADGVVRYESSSAQRVLGYPAEALVGRRFLDLVHRDSAMAAACLLAEVRAAANLTRTGEVVLLAADGPARSFEATLTNLFDVPLVGGVLANLRDITERKEMERSRAEAEVRHWAVLQSAMDCIITIDHHGRITEFNPAAEIAFGYSRAEVLGRALADTIIPPDLREAHRAGMRRFLATGEGPVLGRRVEIMAMRRDGSEFPVELAITAVSSAGGPIFTGYLRDITERRRAERELIEAKESALKANTAKSHFLARMSHELRTPLNAVMGFSQVMMNESFGPLGSAKYAEYAHDIHASGTHLLDLVGDLLDLAKIEAGKVRIDDDEIDLAAAASEVAHLLRDWAQASGVRQTSTLAAGLPLLRADRRAVKQMLLNLASNAVKFTPAGGAVTLSAAVDEAGALILAVADTGIGIPPQDVARVLEPFGQTDSLLSRGHRGTGLGLPIVKALIELHGGRLELASEPGTGTVVRLVFPPERLLAAGGDAERIFA